MPLEQHVYCSLLAHTCLPIQLSFPSALTETFSRTQLLLNISTYGLWIFLQFPFCQGTNTTSSLPLWLCLSMVTNADKLLQYNPRMLEQHRRQLKPPVHALQDKVKVPKQHIQSPKYSVQNSEISSEKLKRCCKTATTGFKIKTKRKCENHARKRKSKITPI